ncbi:MAG: GNAT family N-acetyltransferase [Candidatus Cloacimonadaceae bacterium]|nr:GNAT family N-acetyltransferase [Candidatus Cloacimonadaceae bacterium]
MSKLSFTDAKEITRKDWQIYVENHEHGTIFHTPYIYDVFEATPNYAPFAFFTVNENSEILAFLSGFVQTVMPGMLSGISSRAIMLHSPIYSDLNALAVLIKGYRKWASRKAVYTEIRNHYLDQEYFSSLESNHYVREGHYNIVKEIPSCIDDLWKSIGRKRKDGINKAKKLLFDVKHDLSSDSINDFYRLLKHQYSKLALPIPDIRFFENCVDLDPLSYCKYFQLKDEGNTKVSLLSFVFKDTLYAVYIGIDQDPMFLNKRPVDFFYYEVMKWCAQNRIKYFDWMGAGKPDVSYGVRDFKLQYGGELVDIGRHQLVHSPIKYVIAKAGFKLTQRLKGQR